MVRIKVRHSSCRSHILVYAAPLTLVHVALTHLLMLVSPTLIRREGFVHAHIRMLEKGDANRRRGFVKPSRDFRCMWVRSWPTEHQELLRE